MPGSLFDTHSQVLLGSLSKISLLLVTCPVSLKIWKLTHSHIHAA